MALASKILSSIFEEQIYNISSLFLGFIILAIPVIIKEEKSIIKGKYKNIIFTLIGIAIVALITYFNPVGGEGNIVDITTLNIVLSAYIFFAGMIAISAMILPGISGSTLLLIFGIYIPIMKAVSEIMSFNFEYLPVAIAFGLGVIVGVLLIVKLIKKALEKYRSQTIYTIIGLMIGSIYAIIMGPTTLDVPKSAMNFDTFNIWFFIIGAGVIIALQLAQKFIEKKK